LIIRKKLQIALLIICVAVVLSGLLAFRNLAEWLVVSDPLPQSLNAVFTFAGDVHRINYSKELFNRYPQARWLMSYPSRKIVIPLRRDGFDTSRIAIVDTCKNTNAEVWFITDWARHVAATDNRFSRAQPLRVGFVSSPFHMRRIRMAVLKTPRDESCAYYYLPVPLEHYGWTKSDYRSWWKNDQLRSAVWLEFKKFTYYFWKS
jgi:uncharacterized SAM-binding protein YcdF (DUF218 family)